MYFSCQRETLNGPFSQIAGFTRQDQIRITDSQLFQLGTIALFTRGGGHPCLERKKEREGGLRRGREREREGGKKGKRGREGERRVRAVGESEEKKGEIKGKRKR